MAAYTSFTYIPDGDIQSIFGAALVYGGIAPILGTETYVSGAGLIKSPANYVGINTALIITRTAADTGKCTYQFQGTGDISYRNLSLYYVLPASEIYDLNTWRGRGGQPMGAEFSSFRPTLVSRLLELGADPKLMKTCSMISGEGAPSVHVPMVALTEHISQTVTVNGRVSTALSPVRETTPAAPVPSPTALPAQTSASQAVQPSPQPTPAQIPQAPSVPSQGQPTPSQGQPQPQSAPSHGEGQPQPFASQLEVPQPPTRASAPVSAVVLGSQTIAVLVQTSSPAIVLPGDVALRPGDVVTISSQVLSLQSVGGALIVLGASSTTTVPLAVAPPVPTQLPPGTPTPVSAVVLGSNTIAVSLQTSSPAVVLPDGVTLRPGDAVTFSSHVLSLQSTGSALVVLGKSSTTTIPLVAPARTKNLPATVVTIASATVSIQYVTGTAGGIFLSNGDTLLPGSATEMNGVTVSLAPSVTQLVVGTLTVKLTGGAPASTSQPGAGDYIWSGIGGGPATTSTPAQFTGSASQFFIYAPVALASIACTLLLVLV
ncbi:hypothetical protein E8E11_005035 [Didymella keratinophila]|nr:hypothetical protein E8E11_005035 [Didymella keratinophila]